LAVSGRDDSRKIEKPSVSLPGKIVASGPWRLRQGKTGFTESFENRIHYMRIRGK
jgi:hypothetical protein